MKRLTKTVLSAISALALVMFPGMTAAGAEAVSKYYYTPDEAIASTTNLPSNFLIGDSEGVRVGVDGVYYIEALGVVPGDVLTKHLTIQNLDMAEESAEGKLPCTLSMRGEPLFNAGPVELLDEVHLELKLDGQTVYSGRLRGDEGVNMIENALSLGTYMPGDQRALDIKLTVGTNWELTHEKTAAEFKWIFYAVRIAPLDAPKTGGAEYGAIGGLIGGTVLLWVFLVLKKRKRDKEEMAQAQ